MVDLAQTIADALFPVFGKLATYTPPAGEPVACTVIRSSADAGIGMARASMQGNTIEVRKSEVAQPVKGGRFVIGNETLHVIEDPYSDDADRVIWKMTVR